MCTLIYDLVTYPSPTQPPLKNQVILTSLRLERHRLLIAHGVKFEMKVILVLLGYFPLPRKQYETSTSDVSIICLQSPDFE